MYCSFIKDPPHPENSSGACIVPLADAKPLMFLFDFPVKDTSICFAEDGWYYLTGTTGFAECYRGNGGIEVWKSKDLIDWISLGIVWSIEKDGSWQKGCSMNATKGQESAVLAPEIHYLRGTFYITYGINRGGTGLLKSMSGLVSGPYEDMGKMTEDGTDASIFEDDDGKVYWVYMDGKVSRMKDDITGLDESPRRVEAEIWRNGSFRYGKEDNRIGTQGAFLIKKDGLYFMFCADDSSRMGGKSIDTFVAVSESVYGPYSRRYLVLPHGGQTTICIDKDNRILASFSGHGDYSVFENRPAIVRLDMVEKGYIRPSGDVILEKGTVGMLKPAPNIKIRDPQVCLGADGAYYLTGTSRLPNDSFWTANDGIHLWRSDDLTEWMYLGLVWDVKKEGTWQNAIRSEIAVWAPEIHYIKDTYWLTYSMKGQSTGLLKSITGQAAGPYIDMGRMTNMHIDSSLFTDEDGSVYYIWQDGKIARMRDDMSGFAEEPKQLITTDGEVVGYEGAFIVKKDNLYILGAAEWNEDYRIDGTYDLMYAVSDKIYGPYSKRLVAVPHGGHGTMFIDRDGNLRSTLFGNDRTAPFRTGLGIVELDIFQSEEGITICKVKE